jgi:hypothetical protein
MVCTAEAEQRCKSLLVRYQEALNAQQYASEVAQK